MSEVPQRSRPQPDLLVVSRVVLDDLHRRDGRVDAGILGGSGFWAAFGAALVLDEVAITCKVGEDFEPYRAQLSSLGIRDDGLLVSGGRTSRTRVTYSGEVRSEEPIPDWDAHVALRTMPSEFTAGVRRPLSYYVFRGWHPGFWEAFTSERLAGSPVLWEIPGSVCFPSERERIRMVLDSIDVLSINRDEAVSLCGEGSPDDLIAELHELGAATVALRLGSAGALVSRDGRIRAAAPPPGPEVVEVTGAGNAFSGAFIAEYARAGGDLDEALRSAMAAAAVAIGQIGPPEDRELARSSWRRYREQIGVTDFREGDDGRTA